MAVQERDMAIRSPLVNVGLALPSLFYLSVLAP